ncbi:MAG: DUF2207 domain-containing protein, partial [Eubacteriales bacterium]|nr:DUF2207 domain-containing protein [Eubacteriales bacterium]
SYRAEGTFAELKSEALARSDYTQDKSPAAKFRQTQAFRFNLSIGLGLIFLILFLFYIRSKRRNAVPYKPNNLRSFRQRQDHYFHELPTEANLLMLYACDCFKRSKRHDYQLLGAYILRWIKMRNVRIFTIADDDLEYFQILNPELKTESLSERMWWNLICDGLDPILPIEIKKLHLKIVIAFDQVNKLKEQIPEDYYTYAYALSLIVPDDKNQNPAHPSYKLSDQGGALYQKILGFKRYLKDYTLLSERQLPDLELWDDYLIAATCLGVADKFAKRLLKIQPDYNFSSNDLNPLNMVSLMRSLQLVNEISESGSHTAAHRSAHGVSASLGGGSGFSGGGSGGGIR